MSRAHLRGTQLGLWSAGCIVRSDLDLGGHHPIFKKMKSTTAALSGDWNWAVDLSQAQINQVRQYIKYADDKREDNRGSQDVSVLLNRIPHIMELVTRTLHCITKN